MSLVVWLVAVAALLLLYARRHRSLMQRWRRFGDYQCIIDAIPGPRSFPLIGTTYTFFGIQRAELPVVMRRQFEAYPRLSRTWLGPAEAHVHITHAEHMEVVLGASREHGDKSWSYRFLAPWLGGGLLTAGGERWRTHRKIITPTFHFGMLETFGEVFAEKSRVLAERIAPWARSGEVVDVYPMITLAALDIVAEAAMGVEVHAQTAGAHGAYVAAITKMGQLLVQRLVRPWLYWDWAYACTADGRASVRTLHTLHSFTESVIRQRRQALAHQQTDDESTGADPPPQLPQRRRLNFLDMLLQSGIAEPPLSDVDIREEVDTFMFEGHDTTTAGMSWTMLLLGLHPEWQELVYAECVKIFDRSVITQADCARMPVLERCIKEAMRLYPPVPNISRKLSTDVQLDGFCVPAGTTAVIELLHLHEDERFWPEPQRFDPDRFLPERTVGRHPFAYLPFSAGTRNCVGQKFAMYEEKVLLSTLVRRFRWRAAVARREEVPYVYELITRPIGGIRLVFEERTSA